jgi:hypothetical protein
MCVNDRRSGRVLGDSIYEGASWNDAKEASRTAQTRGHEAFTLVSRQK